MIKFYVYGSRSQSTCNSVYNSVYSVLVNYHQVAALFWSRGKHFCVLKLSESFMTLCYYVYIYVYWIFKSCSLRVKALHTTHKTATRCSIFHTYYTFFYNCNNFLNGFIYGQNFFQKIFSVSCVVCTVQGSLMCCKNEIASFFKWFYMWAELVLKKSLQFRV